LPPTLPGGWRDVLTGMTARQAGSRLSAAQVAERLRRISAGDDRTAELSMPANDPSTVVMPMATTVMARPPEPAPVAPPPPPPQRRRRGPWIAVFLVVLLIAGAAIAGVVYENNHRTVTPAHCPVGTPHLKGHGLETAMRKLERLACS
jgi:hypothetical protein